MSVPLALTLLFIQSLLASSLILHQKNVTEQNIAKVLVFGDSWGALGPSWTMLRDMFQRHGVNAEVVSTAVSGTTACQWAGNEFNLAAAAARAFPLKGPDFVWLTLGGNDLLAPMHTKCATQAKDYYSALVCALQTAEKARICTKTLLRGFFTKFPYAKVVQSGYDLQCPNNQCVPFARYPYCEDNVTCANYLGQAWGQELFATLHREFSDYGYTHIRVDGACQRAGGYEDAQIGNPIMTRGSPCDMMVACEHPAPDSLGAFMIGEVFWNRFFEGKVVSNPQHLLEPPVFKPAPEWERQYDYAAKDVLCNINWKPNLEDPYDPPPPCNRTFINHYN